VLEFLQYRRLNLADALAGDRKLPASRFESVVGVRADAKTHAQELPVGNRVPVDPKAATWTLWTGASSG
jgi:hypothetical protein